MSLDIRFTLEEQDLDYFRNVMHKAQQQAAKVDEAEIIDKASQLLNKVNESSAPGFVRKQLKKLRTMIAMLQDAEWPLEAQERLDVVSAIAYLYNPEDIINDDVPVLGLIDDAIVIELVVRELKEEIKAYQEFCDFRAFTEELQGTKTSREDWLKSKRHKIFERMRDRLDRNNRTTGGSGRLTTFSLS
jgi:uncharacterized membrane protein YkvA (DUF1232 family)